MDYSDAYLLIILAVVGILMCWLGFWWMRNDDHYHDRGN